MKDFCELIPNQMKGLEVFYQSFFLSFVNLGYVLKAKPIFLGTTQFARSGHPPRSGVARLVLLLKLHKLSRKVSFSFALCMLLRIFFSFLFLSHFMRGVYVFPHSKTPTTTNFSQYPKSINYDCKKPLIQKEIYSKKTLKNT